jgi:predicted branched-subunit amino acid permease
MEITVQPLLQQKESATRYERRFVLSKKQLLSFFSFIQSFGVLATMEEYEQRKLRIFNQVNFFQLLIGLLFPVTGLLIGTSLPVAVWLVACLPACVSLLVLFLNHEKKQDMALVAYFILYPLPAWYISRDSIQVSVSLLSCLESWLFFSSILWAILFSH